MMNKTTKNFFVILFFLFPVLSYGSEDNSYESYFIIDNLIKYHIAKGDFKSVIDISKDINKTDKINFLLGYSYYKTGEYSEAVSNFMISVKRNFLPDYANYFMALSYYKDGKNQEALKVFKKHYKLFPLSVFRKEDRCFITRISLKQKIAPVVDGDFPDTADCVFAKILILQHGKEKNFNRLIKQFLIKYPGNNNESQLLKIAKRKNPFFLSIDNLIKRWRKLIRVNKRLLKLELRKYYKLKRERSCTNYFKGKIKFNYKDYYSAIKYFKKSVKYKGKCGERAYFNMGRAYARVGNNEQSIKSFKNIINKFEKGELYEDALYRIALVHGYDDDNENVEKVLKNYVNKFKNGEYYEDAIWELAQINHHKNKYNESEKYLKQLTTSTSYFAPSQGLYWLGKWSKTSKEREMWWTILNRNFPFNVYTLLTNFNSDSLINLTYSVPVTFYYTRINFKTNKIPPEMYYHLSNMFILSSLFLDKYISYEAGSILSKETKYNNLYILADWLYQNGYYYNAQKIITNYFEDFIRFEKSKVFYLDLISMAFPLVYPEYIYNYGKKFKITPSWIWAIIRQESRFNPNVISGAGAIGLMQIIPDTEKKLTNALGIEDDSLLSPEYNLKLGSYYLKQLFIKYKNPFFAVAAYNAGCDNVNLWVKENKESDAFLEEIPFNETKGYVRKVISNWTVYNFLNSIGVYNGYKN